MVSSRALRRMLFVHCGSRCLCRNLLFGVLWDARIAADFGRRSFEVLGFGRATRLAGADFCVWGVGQQPKSNFEPEPVRLQSPVLNHAPVLNPAHVKREMDASESDCEILVVQLHPKAGMLHVKEESGAQVQPCLLLSRQSRWTLFARKGNSVFVKQEWRKRKNMWNRSGKRTV